VENQLSPSLISLSPLITNHPNIFQHEWVQSSHSFNLFMIRSLGFGSKLTNYFTFYNNRFHYAYFFQIKLASQFNSLAHDAKGTLNLLIIKVLQLLIHIQFQLSFTPRWRFCLNIPSQYFTLSVIKLYLSLEGGPPLFKLISA
jgi:hypothetical protein